MTTQELKQIISPSQFRELAQQLELVRAMALRGRQAVVDKTWVADIRKFAEAMDKLEK
jgi:hypothetical protein